MAQIVDLLSNVRITEFFIFIQHFLWENEAVEMSNFVKDNARKVDFRSGWALCCCRFAFAQKKHLLLPLRFRTEKTFVAAASLSHSKNICCCRFAFAQKKHL
ncbi:hypothetical protein [Lysinibacillus sp. NPDC096382]|uniref:hypothetical protein n=1 Tax=Lysinibacillus sp. NPDC096382 TaxID=3364136 RepID=UPI0037F20870